MQWVGRAVFSKGRDKFYVNSETGLWIDHQTGDKGNTAGFLGLIAELYNASLDETHARELARRLRMPCSAVRRPDIGYDPSTESFTFTYRDRYGKVVDIRRRQFPGKPLSTKGCQVGLWKAETLRKAKQRSRVWIVEGESDWLAWRWLLGRVGCKHDLIVAVPGASTFKDHWAQDLARKDVRCLFDNDSAGRDGAKRANRILSAAGIRARFMMWDEKSDDKRDIRDFVLNSEERGIPVRESYEAVCKQLRHLELDPEDMPSRKGFRLQTANEIMQEEPPGFLVDLLLPEQSVAAVVGQPSSGKSLFAHALAVGVAAGTLFFGRELRSGNVLVVAAEGKGGLSSRLKAAMNSLSPKERARAGRRLFIMDEAPRIHDASDVDHILHAVRRLGKPPVLLVLDTLARCMPGGDENSSQDMGMFIAGVDRLARELRCSVLILHHTTKDGSIERGSSALRGALDVLLRSRLKDGFLTITFDKCRDFETPKPLSLKLEPCDESVRLAGVGDGGPGEAVRQLRILTILKSNPEGVTVQRLQRKSGYPRRTLERTLTLLRKNRHVLRKQVGPTARYRLAPASISDSSE